MEQPNVRHEPPVLLRLIQGYVASGITVDEMRRRERELRRSAEERLAKALADAPARRLLSNSCSRLYGG